MTLGRITRIAFLVSIAILFFAFIASSGGHRAAAALPQIEQANPHCRLVGGTVMTNFGAIDQNTTLGTATGDLRGAVSGTILGTPQPGSGNTVIFHVQHHWVTESGDTLSFEPATATTVPLSQTLFAVVTYPLHLTGGTGRFAGATGDINAIGEADLVKGTIFRYSGEVCFAAPGNEQVKLVDATTKEVVPGSGAYAILDYPVHINGGAGRFAGATGDFHNIGAADLGTGRTVFRYSGQVCFAAPDKP